MRWLLRIVLFVAGTVLLVLVVGFCWLYFYSSDLPDVGRLAQYAPATVGKVSDPCLAFSNAISSSTAVPYEEIGTNVRNAISVVETSESDPGVLRTTLRGLMTEAPRRPPTVASWYVSRTMCYPPLHSIGRQLREIRTAIQLERHYSRRQLFTIFANRSYFGPGLIGVEDGAEFYFHKHSAELSIAEAALLVGLVRSPTVYSPLKHPDRALRRRNEVIDAMVDNGRISLEEAQVAKSAQLGIIDVASVGTAKRVSP